MWRSVWLALAACGDAASEPPPPGVEVPETDVPDDPPDSDPVRVESDEPGDDSDPPAPDSDPPRPPPTPFAGVTGGFVDVTASLWASGRYVLPPEDEDWPQGFPGYGTPAWGDLDGDGLAELVVSGARRADAPARSRRYLVFQDRGAGFVEAPALAAGLAALGIHEVLAVVDLDNDGDDDVLRGTLDDGPILLWDGDEHELATVNGVANVAAGNTSAMLVDLDADGWLDVVFGADPCSFDPGVQSLIPVLRTDEHAWTVRADLVPDDRQAAPYALLLADVGLADPVLVSLGESCAWGPENAVFFAPGAPDLNGWRAWAPEELVPSDAWFRQIPGGFNLSLASRQPMGGANADVDGDGVLDVLVAPSDTFLYTFAGGPSAPLRDLSVDLYAPLELGPTGEPKLPWAVVVMDVDLDGWVDVLVGRGDDGRMITQGTPYNGPYQPSAFYNDEGYGFYEARDLIGLDAVDVESQTLLAVDIDDDGDRDLLVGGMDTFPRVLRNDRVAPRRAVSVRLVGTTSNHLAVGATVRADVPGLPPQVRRVGGEASDHGVSDTLVELSAGALDVVPELVVTWPTGVRQVLRDVPAGGVVEVAEPVTISLSEADRHLRANGAARLVVDAIARTEEGAPDPGAAVAIELAAGTGTWEGPAARDGDGWTRTLIAPTARGSAVIEVTVDGVPLAVRPRVWWD